VEEARLVLGLGRGAQVEQRDRVRRVGADLAGATSSAPNGTSGAMRTSRRLVSPRVAASSARKPSVACGDGVAAYGTTTTRAAPPAPRRNRRWKYGS
jgi:hypothetical protein